MYRAGRQRHPQPRGLGAYLEPAVDSGGVLVAKDIRIEIELEAVLQQ